MPTPFLQDPTYLPMCMYLPVGIRWSEERFLSGRNQFKGCSNAPRKSYVLYKYKSFHLLQPLLSFR